MITHIYIYIYIYIFILKKTSKKNVSHTRKNFLKKTISSHKIFIKIIKVKFIRLSFSKLSHECVLQVKQKRY
jgi:hypothetical protein